MGQREIRGIIRVGGLPQLVNAPYSERQVETRGYDPAGV